MPSANWACLQFPSLPMSVSVIIGARQGADRSGGQRRQKAVRAMVSATDAGETVGIGRYAPPAHLCLTACIPVQERMSPVLPIQPRFFQPTVARECWLQPSG